MTPFNHSTPLVSIICLTYNHEQYLSRALDGFVQQTIFDKTEILVHDDASVDGTRQILTEYAAQFPETIRPVLRERNLRSQDISLYEVYTRYLFPEARGKYLAICEGDDYWTDPLKLSKQVDFLESHPDYTVCFHHAATEHDEKIDEEEHHRNTGFVFRERDEFVMEDLLHGHFIQNCTAVYRNLHQPYPVLFTPLLLSDWPLHLFHACSGKIKYLPEVMAVHRVHENGIWNHLSAREQAFHACRVLELFMEFLDERYHPVIQKTCNHYGKI